MHMLDTDDDSGDPRVRSWITQEQFLAGLALAQVRIIYIYIYIYIYIHICTHTHIRTQTDIDVHMRMRGYRISSCLLQPRCKQVL
jgi:hypothetical protein